jgi:translation initiation factor 6
MKVLLTNFHGDHNLGLFGKASDKFCILGNFVSERNKEQTEDVLKVKTVRITVANTDLVGVFSCINSNGILLPKIATVREIELLKNMKRELDINLEILNSKFTALGNLILCNDRGAVVSRNFSKKDKKRIGDCLGVESEFSTIAKMDVVGSCGVATNKGCIVHRDASEEEVKKIEEILKVQIDIGTANFGSPFVGSCAIANSNGAVVGESTTGPEINRIMGVLELI